MENVITEVSKYLIILLMMIYTFSCFTVFRKRDIEDQRNVLRRQIVLMLFMNLVAYTVLFLQNNDMKILMMYGAVFLFIVVVQILYRVIYRKGNLLMHFVHRREKYPYHNQIHDFPVCRYHIPPFP